MKREAALTAALLTGCAVPTETPDLAYAEAREQVARDLEALASLQMFEVGALVLEKGMPGNCYTPCEDEDERVADYLEQARRLHDLVDLADDDLDELGPCYTRASDIVDESLQALSELEILHIGALLQEEAEPDPMCYNLPCPDDVARAEEVNEERALRIWHLSERSSQL